MLVHSYIYYELNENIVSDSQWSKWATELADLQAKYPDISKQVIYANDFDGWDGSSGAFLTYKDKPNIIVTAERLLGNKQSAPKVAKPLIPIQPKATPNKTSTTKKKLF